MTLATRLRRRLLRALRDPFWPVLLGALVAGAVAGTLMAREQAGDPAADAATALLGAAWRKNANDSRGLLMTLFGIQLTLLTVVLSMNAPMIQSSANQYSPRLVPFYLRNAPLRRALPVFALVGGFILAAVREIGVAAEDVVRPRPVISVAAVLLVVAFSALGLGLVRTYRFMRVERILGLVRDATLASVDRLAARARRLRLCTRPAPRLPEEAVPMLAPASGYLVDVDARELARAARRAGVSARVCRAVGDYVDRDEVVGWVFAAASAGNGAARPAPPDARAVARLTARLVLAPTREPELDPAYGLRILADVAARAVSSSSNDAYTAWQALQQARSVLRRAARAPLGDLGVVDPDGWVRVSLMTTGLRELIAAAVEAPLRYGAGSPEVLHGVLEIALEVGVSAGDDQGRAAARQLVTRVLADARAYGALDRARFEHLLAEAALVRASLDRDAPRAERLVRPDWGLAVGASDEIGAA